MGHKRFERCFKVLLAMVCHIRMHRCARVHNGNVEFEEAILQCLKLLEILENCIVFLNERIYISALYRRHKCAVQVKCNTSISVLYK